MSSVTVRELRNHGGDVLDQVEAGQSFVVTRDGRPVAELSPLRRRSAPTATLVSSRRTLPQVDPRALQRDIDELIDPVL